VRRDSELIEFAIVRATFISVSVNSRIDNCFFTATANGFNFRNRVRHFKKPQTAREKLGQKVGTQTIAKYGNIQLVHDFS
jgi:hypothetical protein